MTRILAHSATRFFAERSGSVGSSALAMYRIASPGQRSWRSALDGGAVNEGLGGNVYSYFTLKITVGDSLPCLGNAMRGISRAIDSTLANELAAHPDTTARHGIQVIFLVSSSDAGASPVLPPGCGVLLRLKSRWLIDIIFIGAANHAFAATWAQRAVPAQPAFVVPKLARSVH